MTIILSEELCFSSVKRLIIEEEAIRILNQLGLTNSQARIYLTLLKLDEATAKKISNHSKVPRQEVYRILVELEKKSLVERIIVTPTKFKPVEIEKGLSFLIEERRKKTSEIQKAANELRHRLRISLKPKKISQEEKFDFILVHENKAFMIRMKRALDVAQMNIECIHPKEDFLQALFNLSDNFQKTLERGVKIHCILNEPLDANSQSSTVKGILQNSLFEIRVMSESSEEKIWIIDEKEVFISTCPKCSYNQAPILCTNATPFIKLAQNYFDALWNKAVELEIQYIQ